MYMYIFNFFWLGSFLGGGGGVGFQWTVLCSCIRTHVQRFNSYIFRGFVFMVNTIILLHVHKKIKS